MPAEYAARAFAYDLPPELIAQKPAAQREDARLLVLNRAAASLEHKHFWNIPEFLTAKDLLVFNDTKVLPARLLGQKDSGAKCEIFLLKQLAGCRWECLVRPGRRLPAGSLVRFGADFSAQIGGVLPDGRRSVELIYAGELVDALSRYGQTPLPPYIKPLASAPLSEREMLAERYQTVYARVPGASAAPTAGLHFSGELLAKIKTRGVAAAFVTLHVGPGTFQPLKTQDIREHRMHAEEYFVPAETVRALQDCRRRGGRVIAVGTTVVRALETMARDVRGCHGRTDIYIYPGYKFQVVDALITNFHLPYSTLLLLVSAFAGREKILNAYQEAIKHRYRFFSFGDAMLIL